MAIIFQKNMRFLPGMSMRLMICGGGLRSQTVRLVHQKNDTGQEEAERGGKNFREEQEMRDCGRSDTESNTEQVKVHRKRSIPVHSNPPLSFLLRPRETSGIRIIILLFY